MESEIVVTDDIISIVAKRLGYSEEQIKQVMKYNIDYIQHLVSNSNALTIRFPWVGCMYFNARRWLRFQYRENNLSIEERKIFEQSRDRMTILNEWQKDQRDKGKLKGNTKHYRKKFLQLKSHTGKMNIEELEEFQNNYAEE